jgi:hypothetical protein
MFHKIVFDITSLLGPFKGVTGSQNSVVFRYAIRVLSRRNDYDLGSPVAIQDTSYGFMLKSYHGFFFGTSECVKVVSLPGSMSKR